MKDALGHGSNARGGSTSTVGVFDAARAVMARARAQVGIATHSARIDQLPRGMTTAAKERTRINRAVDQRHRNR